MDFDSIKSRRLGAFGSASIILNDSGDLVRFEGSWSFISLLASRRVDRVSVEFDRGCRHGRISIVEAAMRRPSAMPELHENRCPFLMESGGDLFPSFDLRVVVNPRRIDPTESLLGNRDGLGNDESGRGALDVVFLHQIIRHTGHPRSCSCEWCHDHSVAQGDSMKIKRREQVGEIGSHGDKKYGIGEASF